MPIGEAWSDVAGAILGGYWEKKASRRGVYEESRVAANLGCGGTTIGIRRDVVRRC